jgi:hypothetical protein
MGSVPYDQRPWLDQRPGLQRLREYGCHRVGLAKEIAKFLAKCGASVALYEIDQCSPAHSGGSNPGRPPLETALQASIVRRHSVGPGEALAALKVLNACPSPEFQVSFRAASLWRLSM